MTALRLLPRPDPARTAHRVLCTRLLLWAAAHAKDARQYCGVDDAIAWGKLEMAARLFEARKGMEAKR